MGEILGMVFVGKIYDLKNVVEMVVYGYQKRVLCYLHFLVIHEVIVLFHVPVIFFFPVKIVWVICLFLEVENLFYNQDNYVGVVHAI